MATAVCRLHSCLAACQPSWLLGDCTPENLAALSPRLGMRIENSNIEMMRTLVWCSSKLYAMPAQKLVSWAMFKHCTK